MACMSSAAVTIDESVPHVLVATWPEVVAPEALEAFIATMDRRISRGARFVCISDAGRISDMPGVVRRRLVEWSGAQKPETLQVATVTVTGSKVVHGLLTAVGWFLRADQRAFSLSAATAEEGVRIAAERL